MKKTEIVNNTNERPETVEIVNKTGERIDIIDATKDKILDKLKSSKKVKVDLWRR